MFIEFKKPNIKYTKAQMVLLMHHNHCWKYGMCDNCEKHLECWERVQKYLKKSNIQKEE